MLVENRLHSFYRMIHVAAAAAAGTAMFLSFFPLMNHPSLETLERPSVWQQPRIEPLRDTKGEVTSFSLSLSIGRVFFVFLSQDSCCLGVCCGKHHQESDPVVNSHFKTLFLFLSERARAYRTKFLINSSRPRRRPPQWARALFFIPS